MGAFASLDRKLARALDGARGIRLTGEDMDALALAGVLDSLSAAAVNERKQEAEWRGEQRRKACIGGGDIGSTETCEPMEASGPQTSRSFGMTPKEDASAVLARAQRIVAKPNRRSTAATCTTGKVTPFARPAANAGKAGRVS